MAGRPTSVETAAWPDLSSAKEQKVFSPFGSGYLIENRIPSHPLPESELAAFMRLPQGLQQSVPRLNHPSR